MDESDCLGRGDRNGSLGVAAPLSRDIQQVLVSFSDMQAGIEADEPIRGGVVPSDTKLRTFNR